MHDLMIAFAFVAMVVAPALVAATRGAHLREDDSALPN
jgi:hypothetical protein